MKFGNLLRHIRNRKINKVNNTIFVEYIVCSLIRKNMSIYHSAQNTIFQEQLLNNYQIIIRLAFNCYFVYCIVSCLEFTIMKMIPLHETNMGGVNGVIHT